MLFRPLRCSPPCWGRRSSPFRRRLEPASPADQGVTSTTIRIGIPVINFAALESVGVTLNDGNFQDAFNALTANMNAHGGIDGRKVIPYFVETNPAVASSGNSSCSALTEDDKVFIVMFPVYPDCYQQDHDTPVIGGVLPGALPASAAPDFSLTPPDAAYDPIQLAAFNNRGVFKGKKVGIFYGADALASEVKVVQSDLKRLHVDVVLSGDDSVPATDTVAVDQEAQTIALRFQSAGVNEVVGVGGTGATVWPRALQDTQSTYKPPWIATNVTSLASVRSIGQGRKSLSRQRVGFDSGAVGIPGVDGSGDATVRSDRSQGVSIGRHWVTPPIPAVLRLHPIVRIRRMPRWKLPVRTWRYSPRSPKRQGKN